MWLALLASAIIAVWFNGDAAAADGGGQPAPDTNMLCVSKCGTCPTVCSSSPPPPSSSSYGGIVPPGTPSGGYGSSSSSPSSPSSSHSTSPPGQSKGDGHPSSYYYFFTSDTGRRAGPSGYALVVFAVLVAIAGFK